MYLHPLILRSTSLLTDSINFAVAMRHNFPSKRPEYCKASTSFESLPCEIILNILPRVSDLATLCSIIHASPSALRAFKRYDSASTVEAVLSSGYTCQQIQFIFRFCALFRSRKPLPWYDWTLWRIAFQEPIQAERSQDVFQPEPLAQDTAFMVIHSLLKTARDITNMSLDCLADRLQRFRSLEPQMPVDESFTFCSAGTEPNPSVNQYMGPVSQGSFQAAWDHQPQTTKLELTDIGSPTWTEGQRVMRAFWRLQLAYDSDWYNTIREHEHPPSSSMQIWWIKYRNAIHRPINPSQPPEGRNKPNCYDGKLSALFSMACIGRTTHHLKLRLQSIKRLSQRSITLKSDSAKILQTKWRATMSAFHTC